MPCSLRSFTANIHASRAALSLLAVLVAVACDTATAPQVEPFEGSPLEGRKARGELVVLSPVAGDELVSKVEFRARVDGLDPSEYTLTWRVDWGAPTTLYDAGDGTVAATVDVSSWEWNGAGPYTVTFRAEDWKGRRIGEQSVDVTVPPDGILHEPGDTTGTGSDTTSVGGDPRGPNPLAGSSFWVDPASNAALQADAWRWSRPEDAALMDVMAAGSQADWFGDWTANVQRAVSDRTDQIVGAGALPVYVLYNIPGRDCGSYSGGGARGAAEYRAWIDAVAAGLGSRKAVVILEPDALALLECLPAHMADERLALLRYAVTTLKSRTSAVVYIDAGHARWHPVETTASRLELVGIDQADGFALNVSNFVASDETAVYGQSVSGRVGGARFVIDTSRNGRGAADGGAWCNPTGRGLGAPATVETGIDGLDAFLWIKRPGESDGTCNGGPSAGSWWAEYALGLAQRSGAAAGVVAQ